MTIILALTYGGILLELDVLGLFKENAQFAIILSILINIVISILGIIPSYFLTTANILFFGFWYGTLISFIGEAFGAVVSFYIYRYGFKRLSTKLNSEKHPKIKRLLDVQGKEAFTLILSLRLFPFIPSGAVNIFAAFGKVSIVTFITASSIGKIPSILIEAYSVNQVLQNTWQGKLIFSAVSIYLLIFVYKKVQSNRKPKLGK